MLTHLWLIPQYILPTDFNANWHYLLWHVIAVICSFCCLVGAYYEGIAGPMEKIQNEETSKEQILEAWKKVNLGWFWIACILLFGSFIMIPVIVLRFFIPQLVGLTFREIKTFVNEVLRDLILSFTLPRPKKKRLFQDEEESDEESVEPIAIQQRPGYDEHDPYLYYHEDDAAYKEGRQ